MARDTLSKIHEKISKAVPRADLRPRESANGGHATANHYGATFFASSKKKIEIVGSASKSLTRKEK